MNITLGNPAPRGGVGLCETTVSFGDVVGSTPGSHQANGRHTDIGRLGWLTEEERPYFVALLEVEDLWPAHATAPPSYVKGDDPVFTGLLSKVFGCPVQE